MERRSYRRFRTIMEYLNPSRKRPWKDPEATPRREDFPSAGREMQNQVSRGIGYAESNPPSCRKNEARMLYVDHLRIPFGRMLMSHLVADTQEELRDAARKLGLQQHIQYPGGRKEHLDLSESKRIEAIRMGAKEVTAREIVRIQQAKHQAQNTEEETP